MYKPWHLSRNTLTKASARKLVKVCLISERNEWVFRTDGFGLKKRRDCGFFAVNREDSRIFKTQWIVDQLLILARIPDCACLDARILGLKRNLDHRSFFSLGRYVNEFIQIISSSNEAHLNSRVGY